MTPGFRVEHISYDQTNRLANNGQGVYGKTNFTEVLPGVGVTYSPFKNNTFFFGAHRGMAPPQISDAITGTGQVVDLGPELNWTYELGVRGTSLHGLGIPLPATRLISPIRSSLNQWRAVSVRP